MTFEPPTERALERADSLERRLDAAWMHDRGMRLTYQDVRLVHRMLLILDSQFGRHSWLLGYAEREDDDGDQ